jgi:hypothetical protein
VEEGFSSDPVEFDTFIEQLLSIRPRPGTTFNFELANGCTQEEQF